MKRIAFMSLGAALLVSACTGSGPQYDGEKGIFSTPSNSFKTYVAPSGNKYRVSASDQNDPTNVYKLLILRQFGTPLVLTDADAANSPAVIAATKIVDADAEQYVQNVMCQGKIYLPPTPARGETSYNSLFTGWGYKVRCGG